MTEERLRIEMPSAELDELRLFLAASGPADVRVQPIQDTSAETARQEPITIALIAVGTTAGIKALAEVVNTWVEQREKTKQAALEQAQPGMQLTLERDGRKTTVSLKDLAEKDG